MNRGRPKKIVKRVVNNKEEEVNEEISSKHTAEHPKNQRNIDSYKDKKEVGDKYGA